MRFAISFVFIFFYLFLQAQQPDTTIQTPKPPKEIYLTFGHFYERFTYNTGYLNPLPANATVNSFNSPIFYNFLRARFGLDYYYRKKFVLHINFQDVKFFGQYPDLFNKALDLHKPIYEAWGEYYFGSNLSIKAGRMPLVYDNQRIFSNQAWLPQALTHNVFLLKYEDMFNVHLGVAYDFYNPNELADSLPKRNYKIFEFVWLWGAIGSMDISLLAVNVSVPEVQYIFSPSLDYIKPLSYGLVNYQTVGVFANIGQGPVFVNAEFYYQFGQYPHDWILTDSLTAVQQTLAQFNLDHNTNFLGGPKLGKKINAYMFSVSAKLKLQNFSLLAGYDYLSGDSYFETGADNNNEANSFDPLFGDFHKFYGAMDYFYADSWITGFSKFTPGLQDIYADLKFESKRVLAQFTAHYFATTGEVMYYDEQTSDYIQITKLGYEGDLRFQYNLIADVASIELSGCLLIPTKGLIWLKNLTPSLAREKYFALWIGFRLKPTLYKAYRYEVNE